MVYVRNASYSDKYIVSRSWIRKSERKQTGPVDRSMTVFEHAHIFASKISISGDWQKDWHIQGKQIRPVFLIDLPRLSLVLCPKFDLFVICKYTYAFFN